MRPLKLALKDFSRTVRSMLEDPADPALLQTVRFTTSYTVNPHFYKDCMVKHEWAEARRTIPDRYQIFQVAREDWKGLLTMQTSRTSEAQLATRQNGFTLRIFTLAEAREVLQDWERKHAGTVGASTTPEQTPLHYSRISQPKPQSVPA